MQPSGLSGALTAAPMAVLLFMRMKGLLEASLLALPMARGGRVSTQEPPNVLPQTQALPGPSPPPHRLGKGLPEPPLSTHVPAEPTPQHSRSVGLVGRTLWEGYLYL